MASFVSRYAIPLTIGYYLTSDYIHCAINFIKDKIYHQFVHEIRIDRDKSPKSAYAIIQEFSRYNIDTLSQLYSEDGQSEPDFTIQYGTYNIMTYFGTIILIYGESEIKLIGFKYQILLSAFKNYYRDIYYKHCAPGSLILFYTSENDKWSTPIYRRPPNINDILLTKTMQKVVDDVDQFIQEAQYDNGTQPYHRGYLLYGDTGTGKSTLAGIIATKYDRSVYLLNFNSGGMTDTILINLCSVVPPNSVICIDEIDKQLEFLFADDTAKISMGGILTALDGPQRLSFGTIVILTANSNDFIPKENYNAFFRKGRIEKIFHLDEQFK
jgi:hypothetical protein